jgi:hypothetical protein
MTIAAVSGNGSTQAWQATMQQRKQDFSQLGSALQSGDLDTAQKAFADLQSLSGSQTQNGTTQASNANSGSTVANDFAALGQALKSGNLSDAQSAFAKIQTDMKAQKGGHHHHRAAAAPAAASTTGSQSTDSTTAGSTGTGSIDFTA